MMLVGLLLFVGVAQAQQYYGNPDCWGGRETFVHLMEWKWTDIAKECEEFLQWYGYCAVQVSPPSEHIIVEGAEGGHVWYPWWQRYQPVSYLMGSRSGNEGEFQNMISRCNNVGVRIYVDTVVNHMAAAGKGFGTSGSWWDGDSEDFPGVPFRGNNDFHGSDVCHSWNMEINNYGDANEIRNCRLVGLRDLRHSNWYVQEKIAEYMNKMIDWGLGGFRIDAAKHMWPHHMQEILDRLHNLNSFWFPGNTRPFVFQEVIDLGGEAVSIYEYLPIARGTEFRYGAELGEAVRRWDSQKISYLKNFGEGWGFIAGLSAVVFVDNHDTQRGHGPGGAAVLTYHNPKFYKVANAYMLAWPYGYPKVMSSYSFDKGCDWCGPPADGMFTYDVSCFNGWECEHKWRQIHNMARFRGAVSHTNVENWWDNGDHAIAFSRGNKGFIVINNQGDRSIHRDFYTGLPDGKYCDVITCWNNRPDCGETSDGCRHITVHSGGWANIFVPNDDNPIVAIHV